MRRTETGNSGERVLDDIFSALLHTRAARFEHLVAAAAAIKLVLAVSHGTLLRFTVLRDIPLINAIALIGN